MSKHVLTVLCDNAFAARHIREHSPLRGMAWTHIGDKNFRGQDQMYVASFYKYDAEKEYLAFSMLWSVKDWLFHALEVHLIDQAECFLLPDYASVFEIYYGSDIKWNAIEETQKYGQNHNMG